MKNFRKFIIETNDDEIENFSNSLEQKYKAKVVLRKHNNNTLKLYHLVVPKEIRKKGVGSAIMKDINDYADKNNKRVFLVPSGKDPYIGTTSKNRLIKFYKRHGYVQNIGKNKDFTLSPGMYRTPNTNINEGTISIFRGQSIYNKKGGPMGGKFFSIDKEWSKQFTQSHQEHEILHHKIDEKDIMDKSHIYAGDDIEPHVKEAKEKGYSAVRFNEGQGEPHSIYVFNKRALK